MLTEVEALPFLEKGELDVESLIPIIVNPHLDEISNTEEDDDDDAGVVPTVEQLICNP